MLNAYLHGKLPSNTADIPGREDVLTATVFERLAYLPPDAALRALFGRLAAPRPTLDGWEQEFWPQWPTTSGTQKTVEPDVVWSVAGIPRIIFEVKWGDEQTFGQLEREALSGMWLGGGAEVLIVGLGGWTAERRRDVLDRWKKSALPSLVAIDWEDLYRNVLDLLHASPPAHERHVLADTVSFLEDRGFAPPRWMESLALHVPLRGCDVPLWSGPIVEGVGNLLTGAALGPDQPLAVPWSPQ